MREEGARLMFLKESGKLKFFVNGTEHLLPVSSLGFAKAVTNQVRSPLEAVFSKVRTTQEKKLFTELLTDGVFRL